MINQGTYSYYLLVPRLEVKCRLSHNQPDQKKDGLFDADVFQCIYYF